MAVAWQLNMPPCAGICRRWSRGLPNLKMPRSIPMISEDVRGIFSLNGGRCGKRGKAINGLAHIQEIYKEIAKNSHIAVAFFAGTRDTVVPLYSTQRLYESFCEGRGIRCKESVYLVIAEGASHKSNSMVQRSGQRIVQFINQGDPNIE